jgi:hypothetical protein
MKCGKWDLLCGSPNSRFDRRHNLFAAFQTAPGIAGRMKGPTREGIYATGPESSWHVNEPGSGYRTKGRR